MNNNFDLYDVRFYLENIVATLDIIRECFTDEIVVTRRECETPGNRGLGVNFVHRSSEIYEPALHGIYVNLFDLLKKVKEVTDG